MFSGSSTSCQAEWHSNWSFQGKSLPDLCIYLHLEAAPVDYVWRLAPNPLFEEMSNGAKVERAHLLVWPP